MGTPEKPNSLEMGRKYKSQAELYPDLSKKERMLFAGVKVPETPIKTNLSTDLLNALKKSQIELGEDNDTIAWKLMDNVVRTARMAGMHVDKVHAGDSFSINGETFFYKMANGEKFRISLNAAGEIKGEIADGNVLKSKTQIKDASRRELDDLLNGGDMTKILYDSMLARGIKFNTTNRKKLWKDLVATKGSYEAAMRTHGDKRLSKILDSDKDFLSKKYVGSAAQHLAMIEFLRSYGLSELIDEINKDLAVKNPITVDGVHADEPEVPVEPQPKPEPTPVPVKPDVPTHETEPEPVLEPVIVPPPAPPTPEPEPEPTPEPAPKTPETPGELALTMLLDAAKEEEFKNVIHIEKTERNHDQSTATGTVTVEVGGEKYTVPLKIVMWPGDYRLEINRFGYITPEGIGRSTPQDVFRDAIRDNISALAAHRNILEEGPKILPKPKFTLASADLSKAESEGVYIYTFTNHKAEKIKVTIQSNAMTATVGVDVTIGKGEDVLKEGGYAGTLSEIGAQIMTDLDSYAEAKSLDTQFEMTTSKFKADFDKAVKAKQIVEVNQNASLYKFYLPESSSATVEVRVDGTARTLNASIYLGKNGNVDTPVTTFSEALNFAKNKVNSYVPLQSAEKEAAEARLKEVTTGLQKMAREKSILNFDARGGQIKFAIPDTKGAVALPNVVVKIDETNNEVTVNVDLGKKGALPPFACDSADMCYMFAAEHASEYEAGSPPKPVEEEPQVVLDVRNAMTDGATVPAEFGRNVYGDPSDARNHIGQAEAFVMVSNARPGETKELIITKYKDPVTEKYLGRYMKNGEVLSWDSDADPRELIKKLLKKAAAREANK